MPEPITNTAAATIATSAVTMPVLTLLGVPLGLRPDELLAGFLGAIAAIGFLNTVPSTGDTWRELLRTSWRRMFVAVMSAVTAGYLTPIGVELIPASVIPTAVPRTTLELGVAFAIGVNAHLILRLVAQVLSSFAERLKKKEAA